jgi:hypothetical protein
LLFSVTSISSQRRLLLCCGLSISIESGHRAADYFRTALLEGAVVVVVTAVGNMRPVSTASGHSVAAACWRVAKVLDTLTALQVLWLG